MDFNHKILSGYNFLILSLGNISQLDTGKVQKKQKKEKMLTNVNFAFAHTYLIVKTKKSHFFSHMSQDAIR